MVMMQFPFCLQELISLLPDGQSKVKECECHAQETMDTTALKGRQAVQSEMDVLKLDWEDYSLKLHSLKDSLEQVGSAALSLLQELKFNPFTAPACKISGLKSAHIHACKQYVSWSCNKSTFSIVRFDRSPFTCSWKGGKKAVMASDLALLLVFFRVTVWQAWQ